MKLKDACSLEAWCAWKSYDQHAAAAAAAAKSLQSCPTLCNPIDGSPPGSPIPGILQARILEWVAVSFSNAWKWKVKGKSLSRVWLLSTPWTVAHQAPPSMGFSRREYWSGVPLPSPYDQHRQHIKEHRYHFVDKGPYSQSYVSSSSHVWMWELDHIEGWVLKNWCFWTAVLEKTLESPLDSKEIKPINPKGDQPFRIFIWRNDAEAPILWPPDAKSYSDAGRDWRQEEKGMTKDEMVGWYHWLNGQESEQAPGDGAGQGSLVCCSPWGCKELDMTEQLNNRPLKAWLELENPLPRWLTHKALGWRPQFPALWASPWAELYPHTW